MIGCHSIVKCRFEAQQRYASTVTPPLLIFNFQFSIFHLRSLIPNATGKNDGKTNNSL